MEFYKELCWEFDVLRGIKIVLTIKLLLFPDILLSGSQRYLLYFIVILINSPAGFPKVFKRDFLNTSDALLLELIRATRKDNKKDWHEAMLNIKTLT